MHEDAPPRPAAARGAAAPPLPAGLLAAKLLLYAQAASGAAAAMCAAAAAAACLYRSLPLWQLAAAWAAVELGFCVYYRGRLRALSAVPDEHRPPGHDGVATAKKFYGLRKYFPFSEFYLRYWFRCADMANIRRQNVLDLLSYGFWYRTKEELAQRGELKFLDGMLTDLQAETGIRLDDGSTPGLPFMSHLSDDLPAIYRPLAFYVVTEFLALVTRAMLWATGFERHDVCGLGYYTRAGAPAPAPAAAAEGGAAGTPVVIMHGVAAGVLPYLELVFSVAAMGRPLVVPEYKHVSMRLTSCIPTVEQLATSMGGFLRFLGHDKVHLMGHSYGSMVASRFTQLHPDAVTTLTLLDPVCFGMFMPTLLYTFLYSFPASGNAIIDAGMYFVSRELHMTATFCRRFFWSDYNLWPEYLPRHTLAVLGGKDRLCQAGDIRRWLEAETPARVMFEPEAVHAAMLMKPSYITEILIEWADMAAAGEADAAADSAARVRVGAPVARAATTTIVEEVLGESAAAEEEEEGVVVAEVRVPRRATEPASLAAALAAKVAAADASSAGDADLIALVDQEAPAGKAAAPAAAHLRQRRRPNPFASSAAAAAAAGGGVSAARGAAAPPPRGGGIPAAPQRSAGPEVEGLMRRLRQQQERVRAQEEANIAAARQLLSIAEAVRRSRGAAAPKAGGGAAEGGSAHDGSGESSDVSSNLDGASSVGSDELSGAAAGAGGLYGRPLGRCYSGGGAGLGGGDVAVLAGGRVYSPLLAFASAAVAGEPRRGPPRRGLRAARSGALALGGPGLKAGALGGAMSGGVAAWAPAGKGGLIDSASIDLGSLAYGAGAFGGVGPRLVGAGW
ncbi:MAG: hypothetical protein J3K34DRAFT_522470 [Monoraphidium minutum]|nr:MAG: hypothetical protein J3K34DRAFT_522470 [Monoraphidium minutum]